MISGEGKILTAGGIDTHVHLLSPSQIVEALATGLTTLGGGGTGPSEGTKATTVTPGAWHLEKIHRSLDPYPINLLLLGKGNTVSMAGLEEQALAGAGGVQGARGLGLDAGRDRCGAARQPTSGACRSRCTPTRSTRPATWSRRSPRSPAGRSARSTSRAPAAGTRRTSSTVAGLPNVIPGSTNPTLPHTVNTVAEHLDMLMVCHHLNPPVPEDLAFAESRIRATTIAAEDILHDMGAMSMTSSDAQAMGRIGEVICRTWQVAHVMKARRGGIGGGLPADNERARRYVAKYTINPAIAHGIDHEVGSVEAGKLADLVLWEPRFFGIRPALVSRAARWSGGRWVTPTRRSRRRSRC